MRRIAVLAAVSLLVVSVVAALAVGVGSARTAGAEREDRVLFTSLVPDLGPTMEPTIAGIAPGGLPWVLRDGHATLSRDGELTVSVEGLLFGAGAPDGLPGTTGPLKMVSASVVCANGPVITTSPTKLSAKGNAHLERRISLPTQCVGPIVLVRAVINGSSGGWLAASGV